MPSSKAPLRWVELWRRTISLIFTKKTETLTTKARNTRKKLRNIFIRRDSRDFLILELGFGNFLGFGAWLLEISIIDDT
jgi:hypothetical protein